MCLVRHTERNFLPADLYMKIGYFPWNFSAFLKRRLILQRITVFNIPGTVKSS